MGSAAAGMVRRGIALKVGGSTVAVAVLIVFLIVALFGALAKPADADGASCNGAGTAAGGAIVPVGINGTAGGLSAEQLQNARTIAGVAIGAKLGKIGVRIVVLTAYTEASLINVNYGDVMNGAMTSSLGLYQQQGPWGPREVRLDPVASTGLFIHGGQGGQEGLLDMPNWWTHTNDPWVPAQWVEKSQFADGSNYRANLATVDAIVDQLLAAQNVPELPDDSIRAAGVSAPGPIDSPIAAPINPGCVTGTGSVAGVANPANGLQQNPSQDPSSFGWVRAQNIVPYSWQGHAFPSGVAAGTEPLWNGLLNDLVPKIPGGLNGYLGGYENRNNVNSPTRVSFHAYGLALDINYDVNANGTNPASLVGKDYAIPPDAARAAAAKWGMEWGGDFPTPDAMHFELHLSPEQVRSLGVTGSVTSAPAAPAP